MNLGNLERLIDRIRTCELRSHRDTPRNKRSFNMSNNFFDCGSPSCLAGHCADLMGVGAVDGGVDAITKFLEIDEKLSAHLFVGLFSKSTDEITVEETLAYLESLRV